MLESHLLPSWSEIFRRIGEPEPRRNRARCPIHGGDSPTSLSVNEDDDIYHCFVCHAAGDKVDFVQRVLKVDFKGALAFFGIQAGSRLPKSDPAVTRQRAGMDAIREWSRRTGRRLRDEHFTRQQIIRYAQERLSANPESELAWTLLSVAFDGEAKNEHLLDEVDLCRSNDERLRAWTQYRNET
jgi:hypothetical protein